ncbi:hypothetical protein QE412_002545 [Microbacterium trichothecenolyticum]|uniref:Uncharacterized protein n=1 Tax=Microbacterium trichothecenolyticum TaxID=69370 RepID=A0ABU0TWD1_MICTR|nr:hypothetical protein [Microbacterium trichothecenolyticum]
MTSCWPRKQARAWGVSHVAGVTFVMVGFLVFVLGE